MLICEHHPICWIPWKLFTQGHPLKKVVSCVPPDWPEKGRLELFFMVFIFFLVFFNFHCMNASREKHKKKIPTSRLAVFFRTGNNFLLEGGPMHLPIPVILLQRAFILCYLLPRQNRFPSLLHRCPPYSQYCFHRHFTNSIINCDLLPYSDSNEIKAFYLRFSIFCK